MISYLYLARTSVNDTLTIYSSQSSLEVTKIPYRSFISRWLLSFQIDNSAHNSAFCYFDRWTYQCQINTYILLNMRNWLNVIYNYSFSLLSPFCLTSNRVLHPFQTLWYDPNSPNDHYKIQRMCQNHDLLECIDQRRIQDATVRKIELIHQILIWARFSLTICEITCFFTSIVFFNLRLI